MELNRPSAYRLAARWCGRPLSGETNTSPRPPPAPAHRTSPASCDSIYTSTMLVLRYGPRKNQTERPKTDVELIHFGRLDGQANTCLVLSPFSGHGTQRVDPFGLSYSLYDYFNNSFIKMIANKLQTYCKYL